MLNRHRLFEQAVELWGLPLQVGMLIEESAELIQACNKYFRGKEKAEFSLAEEMADVEIMIEQIKNAMGLNDLVDDYKDKKLIRLAKRILDSKTEVKKPEED